MFVTLYHPGEVELEQDPRNDVTRGKSPRPMMSFRRGFPHAVGKPHCPTLQSDELTWLDKEKEQEFP